MLRLASQNLENRTVLLIEPDEGCASEMTEAVMVAGGRVVGCVTSGMGAVAFARRQPVDCVMLHTQTLLRISFPLIDMMTSLGVGTVPVTSFDDWYDVDEEDDEKSDLDRFLTAFG